MEKKSSLLQIHNAQEKPPLFLTVGALRVKEVSMYGKTDTMHCRGDHWSSGNLGTKLHCRGRLFFCFLRKPQQFLCNCCAGGESPPLRYLTKLSKNGVIPSKRSASKNPHPAGERTGPSTRCARSGRRKKPEGLPHFSVILSKRSESKNPYFLADCHGAYAPRNDRKKLTGVVSNLLS